MDCSKRNVIKKRNAWSERRQKAAKTKATPLAQRRHKAARTRRLQAAGRKAAMTKQRKAAETRQHRAAARLTADPNNNMIVPMEIRAMLVETDLMM